MSVLCSQQDRPIENYQEYISFCDHTLMSGYVTSPIFYANSKPHIGHIYTGLVCDTWVRCNEIFGNKITFTSGMDEHGQKVFQTAEKLNVTVHEYVGLMNQHFLACFNNHNINYTNWIRTTCSKHEEVVAHVWTKLEKSNYIYKNAYQGWYSISDENYLDLPKDYVNTNPNVVWREEECYYFRLSAFEDKLRNFYEQNKAIIYPNSRYNETIGFLDQGLRDFAISRPKERLSWGIDVPNDPSQVIYVWIDALASYLSAIGYPDVSYKEFWPAVHVIGKDILKFHTIYWPALLMALDLPLPKAFIIHGWWLNGDQKISKSLNNAINIDDITATYGYDALRYYLLSNMTLGEDGSFREALFEQVIESCLSNKFGNLFSRLIGIAKKNNLKVLSIHEENFNPIFLQHLCQLRQSVLLYAKNMRHLDLYINAFHSALDFLNIYVNDNKIWELEGNDLNNELYCLLYSFKQLSLFYSPLLPEACKKVLEYFNTDMSYEDALQLKEINVQEMDLLFPRIKCTKNETV